MEVVRGENAREEAGRALNELLTQYGARPILLLLSGGSALQILEGVSDEVLGTHVTLSVLDERYSTDPFINNCTQLKATDFFARTTKRGVQTFSTEVHEQTMTELSASWVHSLHVWKDKHPDGAVIATMGVGSDGHTAGMFGGEYGVDFSGPEWVVSYSVPKEVHEYTKRITTTYTFLKECVDEAIVYVVGEEKRPILERLTQSVCTTTDMPSCIFHEMQSVKVYTDIHG